MTDILAGINFMIGMGWAALAAMIITHLVQRFRFNPSQERAALRRLLFIAFFKAIEKITITFLATPSNLENANSLPAWIYVVVISSRLASLVALWELVRWMWFDFWTSPKE